MKKFVVLGMGLCMAFAFTSCKSSESAYKKAYEKAKQQELAEAPVAEEAPAAAPVVAAPVAAAPTTPVAVGTVREEKVQLVSGEGLKARLDNAGYSAKVVFNASNNMYRVIVASYDDRVQAAQARDNFKAKYANNAEFQKSWLLYAR